MPAARRRSRSTARSALRSDAPQYQARSMNFWSPGSLQRNASGTWQAIGCASSTQRFQPVRVASIAAGPRQPGSRSSTCCSSSPRVGLPIQRAAPEAMVAANFAEIEPVEQDVRVENESGARVETQHVQTSAIDLRAEPANNIIDGFSADSAALCDGRPASSV